MAGSFLPPVLFTIQANATQALASFNKVNAELKVMEAQALKTGTAMSRTTKATSMAIGATKILAVATAAFAAYGVKEIMQLEESYAKLGQTLAGRGLSNDENRKAAADLAQSYEQLGFDAANAADAFANLIAANGDMKVSTDLMAKAADLARFKHMGLTEAAQLLIRAQAGNARIFKQFGIVMDENLPKAEATKKAMDELNKRIGGQAVAYTKTFKGQLEVLGKQIENFAEAIGAVLLPVLTKMVSGISHAGAFLKKYQAVLIGVVAVITGIVTVAVINLTKKLWAQAAAWAAANWEITLIIAAVVAVAAAFVWAWNKFDWFRKGIVTGLQFLVRWWGFLLRAVGFVAEAFLQIVTGPMRLFLKALGFISPEAKKASKELDKLPKMVGDFFDGAAKKIEGFSDTIETWQDKKIDLSKFKLPTIDVPGFENSMGGVEDSAADAAGAVSDAFAKAAQDIKDFNQGVKDSMTEMFSTYKGIVGKDFEAAIEEGLLNPVDQLVTKAQAAVDMYQGASNKYAGAMGMLIAAQNDYKKSIDSTDVAMKEAAASALKHAEEIVSGITDQMAKGLDDIQGLQSDMISSIVDSMNEISDLESKRNEALAKEKEDKLAAEKDYLKKMTELNKQYNNNVTSAQAEAAKRSAEIVKSSMDQLRNAYTAATSKNIGETYSNLTFGGLYKKGGAVGALTASLKTSLNKAEVLSDDAGKLAGAGFSQTFIQQVISQGTEVGHQMAQSILSGSPESIKELQTYWTALDKQSQHGVDALAKQMNSGMVLATEELTAQLAQVSEDLNTQLAGYARDLAEASASTYSDYQDTLNAISAATTKTIGEIDGQITSLNGKIAQLRAALTTIGTLGAPGTVQTPATLANTSIQPIPLVVKPPVTSSPPASVDWRGIPTGTVNTTTLAGIQAASQMASPAKTIVVNQTNYTQASPDAIADSTAWAIRTAGDVSFAVNPKTNKMIPV